MFSIPYIFCKIYVVSTEDWRPLWRIMDSPLVFPLILWGLFMTCTWLTFLKQFLLKNKRLKAGHDPTTLLTLWNVSVNLSRSVQHHAICIFENSSPRDVMQIARINKLFVQERKCLFLSEISEIFDGVRNIRSPCLHKKGELVRATRQQRAK